MTCLRSVLFLSLLPGLSAGAATSPASIQFGRFGTVPVVRPQGEPSQVVLLLSDRDGLGARESDMAAALARQGVLVLEIDTPRYLAAANHGKVHCVFPAVDFEALSQFGQQTLGLAAYRAPILVGNGALGGTVAYGTLAEAPPGTFAGAVSAGFCPLLDTPKQLCRGNGLREDHAWKQAGQRLLPGLRTEDPWIVLSSPAGSQCSVGSPDAFIKKVHPGQVIPPAADAWRGQLQKAMAVFAERSRKAAASAAKDNSPLKDLPLTEVPARGKETNTLAVILSGSGGWVGLDPQMAKNFAQRGVPVVGISSLAYFWKPRTPDSASQDLARILDHYLAAWHKERAIVVGYSQGADIVPFMVSRLPGPLRSRVSLVALIGPDDAAEFRLHPDGWMSGTRPEPHPPVAPEVARLKGLKVICVYGDKEAGSLCPQLDRNRVERFELTGGHSFGGDAPALIERFMTGALTRTGA